MWRDGKAEVGRVREEKSRREKIREKNSEKKEDAGARKGRKVAKHGVFPMICGSGGSKRGLAKAAGAEPSGQMRDEIVARSTCRSQIAENTSASEHFRSWDVKKSARRCGAKHISKSKGTKHHMFAPLMDVEASFCVAGARDSAPCQKWAKREGMVAVSITTTITLHYTTLHYTQLHYIQLHHTTLHYTTPHYTTLHYATLPYATRHYTTLHPQLQIQLHLQLH